MIGTHDEALETPADRDRAERVANEAIAMLQWEHRKQVHAEENYVDKKLDLLRELMDQANAKPMPLELPPTDAFSEINAKLDRVIAMLQRHGITDEPEYPRIP